MELKGLAVCFLLCAVAATVAQEQSSNMTSTADIPQANLTATTGIPQSGTSLPDLKTNTSGPTLGFRCPFPADANGTWPDYCYDVIGRNCECFMDDIVVTQRECVLMDLKNYERLLTIQYIYEAERVQSKKIMGLYVDESNHFDYWLKCLDNIADILSSTTAAPPTSPP